MANESVDSLIVIVVEKLRSLASDLFLRDLQPGGLRRSASNRRNHAMILIFAQ